MDTPYDILRPDLPAELDDLRELALDLRWSWSHAADALWQRIDPELWDRTANPWLILQTASPARLAQLARDPEFLARLQTLRQEQKQAREADAWFQTNGLGDRLGTVAYFCMEYGLSEALPLYSGGLGVLAGDHLKTASELGIPLVAVGLLYQQGYFRQGLDDQGRQLAFYPYNDPSQMPVRPARNAEGEWVQVSIELPGRPLWLRVWVVQVGRVKLYLLDSNHPLNSPADRGITAELYGGGPEMRLQQEMVLGLGGLAALQALGVEPEVCHLNEGHAALVVLARAEQLMASQQVDFDLALTASRAGNLFTTHTPVAAGFDRFDPALVERYLGAWARERLGITFERLMALGRAPDGGPDQPFQMAWLALRGSSAVNAVSRLHGQVSRRLFQPLFPRWPQAEVPVSHVTNGVHTSTWDSPESDRLWTRACGKERWRGDLERLEAAIGQASDAELWEMRGRNRRRLIEWLAQRRPAPGTRTPHLDPNALTLGFARRFAAYKRPNLLLRQPDRLVALLSDPRRPVQLVLGGKAHPQDHEGQAMIQQWIRFIRERRLEDRVVFVVDHDLMSAERLVQGVDLWINTPRRPWEACGTSGMKVLVNGGLNLSELDGWWAEAFSPEVGWALGDGREHGADPAVDAAEAEQLYQLLEQEIVPLFYQRDRQGVPSGWVARMRASMGRLTPRFSTNRMVRQYTERHYLPLAENYRARLADDLALARTIQAWQADLARHWGAVHFGRLERRTMDQHHVFHAQVYLDDLPPSAVAVELYADAVDHHPREGHLMKRVERLTGAVNGYLYLGVVAAQRPIEHYTVRVRPRHPQAAIPLEDQHILWER